MTAAASGAGAGAGGGGRKRRKAPARKKAARKAPARKKAARRKAAGQHHPRRRRGWRRLFEDLLTWLLWRLGALTLGASLGLCAVLAVLYRQALADVDLLLEHPVWSQTGRVLSGPIQLWPGLKLDKEELAGDLQRAGYARVPKAQQVGDFDVGTDRVHLLLGAEQGLSWRVKAGEATVRFADGRVALADGRDRLTLRPTELASIRGRDNEARRPVDLTEIPDDLVEAVLAMEDARFRDHEGLDPLGIARALLVNAWAGGTVQGGSTLTQQLVKNLFLNQDRTYQRKAKEALLAVALERRRSKDQILGLYLNEIYLGQASGAAVCGVEQAARAYFGKPVQRLDLGESATIAGMISAPNRYSPLRHPEAAIERRDLALSRMVAVGRITAERAEIERQRPLQVQGISGGRRSPWAVDAVLAQVEDDLGPGSVAASGLVVSTTIDPTLQRLAERAIADSAAELDQRYPKAAGAQFALAAIRIKDGAIVALVGSRGYIDSQFDRASSGRRQVGSTVKPLTWLAALQADPDLSPATVVQDQAIERTVDGKRWAPQNYDGIFLGPVSLRQALIHSRNVPAIRVAERVGMGQLVTTWKKLGLSTATDWPSAALGSFGATPVELAGAYSVFPRRGTVISPHLLAGAVDPQGTVLIPPTPSASRRIAGAIPTFMVADILRQVITEGTGRRAASYGVRGPVGGKTGTTDDGRDAWFAGYTGQLAVAVWVGFDKGRALGLTGAKAALPAWSRFVVDSGTMNEGVTPPPGLSRVQVCTTTGLPPCGDCETQTTDWFVAGHEPERDCGLGRLGLLDRLRDQLHSDKRRGKATPAGDASSAEYDAAQEDAAEEDAENGSRRSRRRRKKKKK